MSSKSCTLKLYFVSDPVSGVKSSATADHESQIINYIGKLYTTEAFSDSLTCLVLAACPTAKNGVAVTRDYQASAS